MPQRNREARLRIQWRHPRGWWRLLQSSTASRQRSLRSLQPPGILHATSITITAFKLATIVERRRQDAPGQFILGTVHVEVVVNDLVGGVGQMHVTAQCKDTTNLGFMCSGFALTI